jgi:hypothetical protein
MYMPQLTSSMQLAASTVQHGNMFLRKSQRPCLANSHQLRFPVGGVCTTLHALSEMVYNCGMRRSAAALRACCAGLT